VSETTVTLTPWEEAAPGNVHGTARALTTLAPMPQRDVGQTRALFWLRRLIGRPQDLELLSFIHFARTTLVTGLRDGAGGASPPYIYFESHFNGDFDAYIDAFAYVVPKQMERIWSSAYRFPGPQPATKFKEYIRERDYPAGHFYTAYPKATVTDIARALGLKQRLAPLATQARDAEPDAFADAFYRTLREIPPPSALSARIAHLRRSVPSLLSRRDRNFAIGGQAYGLTLLTPILPGHTAALAEALAALQQEEHDPFAEVGRTHFARLVIIDRFPTEPPGGTTMPPPHLLLSCVIDGHPDSYLRSLCTVTPATVDSIWSHCWETPEPISRDAPAFQSWMRRHQLDTTTFFAPYAEATVEEVVAALHLRDEVESLVAGAQDATSRALQQAFMRRLVEPGELG
jgi:hypothetical protein